MGLVWMDYNVVIIADEISGVAFTILNSVGFPSAHVMGTIELVYLCASNRLTIFVYIA